MPTAYYSHPDCHLHDMGAGHPECPQRLDAIAGLLRSSSWAGQLAPRVAPLVDLADVRRAHADSHVSELTAALTEAERSGKPRWLDADTLASPGTWRAVQRAAGAAVAATDAVMDAEVDNAFCAVRPPGHHATRHQAMGFCFFNNVAVAARHAVEVRGLSRVAIVDFDVHHGNGTEDITAGDDRILMVGLFQQALYPHSGEVPMGSNMLNLPLPAHTEGDVVRRQVQASWLPRLASFKPQMVFISAGFDAHRDDPLGQLGLVEADFEWITRQIKQLAEQHAQGRIVSCLEGGYALGALSRSVAAHVRVLAGLA